MRLWNRLADFFRRGARVIGPAEADLRAIFPEEDIKPPQGTVILSGEEAAARQRTAAGVKEHAHEHRGEGRE